MLFKASRRYSLGLHVETISRSGNVCPPPPSGQSRHAPSEVQSLCLFLPVTFDLPRGCRIVQVGMVGGLVWCMYGFTPPYQCSRRVLYTCLCSAPLRPWCAQSLPRTVGRQRAPECARCMPSAYGRLHPIHALRTCLRSASLCPWGCSALCAALLAARLRLTPLPLPLSFPARVRCPVAPPHVSICLPVFVSCLLVCLSVFGHVCYLDCFLTSHFLLFRCLASAASLPVIRSLPVASLYSSMMCPPTTPVWCLALR
jgi:hypothetical protein